MNNKKDATPYYHRGQWYDTPAADRVPKNRRERKSRDEAAIHEAGHILVAFKHGFGNAWGRIDPGYLPDPDGTPYFVGSWVGTMANGDGICKILHRREVPLTRVIDREIALGGAIAERLAGRKDFRDPEYWNSDHMETGGMSDSDWYNAHIDPENDCPGDDPSFMKSVHAVGDLLKANFSKVRAIARQLIAESRDPPDLHIFKFVNFYIFENWGNPDKYARFLQRNTNHSDPETGVTKL